MAGFKNITGGRLTLTDEKGSKVEFATGETITGLSNYFYNYTAAGGCASPVLLLTTALDGAGVIPAAVVAEESTVFLPGASDVYPKTSSTVTAADLANSNAPRQKNITFDEKGDTAFRQVRTVHVGIKAVPDGTDPANITAFKAANPDEIEGVFLTASGKIYIVDGANIYRFDADETGSF